MRIRDVHITPVAFRDPPLLNTVGVHEPFALRAIVEVVAEDGLYGLGETYGDAKHVARLRNAAKALVGVDVWHVQEVARRVRATLDDGSGGHGMGGMVTGSSTADRVLSPFEVACLDIQGKVVGRPVSDLLGGAVRDRVEYSAYLFYKWAGHPGQEPDGWGAALDPDQLVAQARRIVDGYGFKAIKVKGGVLAPEEEVAAIQALARRSRTRRCGWIRTGRGVWPRRSGSPRSWTGCWNTWRTRRAGSPGWRGWRGEAPMPLATNMCVVAFEHLRPAVEEDAVQVILSDHHFWGGLNRSRSSGGDCDAFGLSLSMHSNSHLGVSLAAMTQLAAATPNLTYACDTHWPWKDAEDDVVVPGVLRFEDGAVSVPTGPGLGVELDRDALARLHEQYVACGLTERDDTGYYRRVKDAGFDPTAPRW